MHKKRPLLPLILLGLTLATGQVTRATPCFLIQEEQREEHHLETSRSKGKSDRTPLRRAPKKPKTATEDPTLAAALVEKTQADIVKLVRLLRSLEIPSADFSWSYPTDLAARGIKDFLGITNDLHRTVRDYTGTRSPKANLRVDVLQRTAAHLGSLLQLNKDPALAEAVLNALLALKLDLKPFIHADQRAQLDKWILDSTDEALTFYSLRASAHASTKIEEQDFENIQKILIWQGAHYKAQLIRIFELPIQLGSEDLKAKQGKDDFYNYWNTDKPVLTSYHSFRLIRWIRMRLSTPQYQKIFPLDPAFTILDGRPDLKEKIFSFGPIDAVLQRVHTWDYDFPAELKTEQLALHWVTWQLSGFAVATPRGQMNPILAVLLPFGSDGEQNYDYLQSQILEAGDKAQ